MSISPNFLIPIIPMGFVTLRLSIIVTSHKIGCFMYFHTESEMFCLGWQNWHGVFCGKSLWYVLSGLSKKHGMCFVPGCFVLHLYNGPSQVNCIIPEGRIHYYTKGQCITCSHTWSHLKYFQYYCQPLIYC